MRKEMDRVAPFCAIQKSAKCDADRKCGRGWIASHPEPRFLLSNIVLWEKHAHSPGRQSGDCRTQCRIRYQTIPALTGRGYIVE